MRGSHLIFVFIFLLGFAGCVLRTPPEASGGHRLPGTEDVRPEGELSFSLSPDGEWILYPSQRGTPFEPVFVAYRVATGESWDIALDDRATALATAGQGPDMKMDCWSQNGGQILLPGASATFVAEVPPGDLRWRVEPGLVSRPSPRVSNSRFSLTRPSLLEVALVDAARGHRVLARHRAQDALATGLNIDHMAPSPDGRYLAYVVVEVQGSFSTAPMAFLLDIQRDSQVEPKLLAAPVVGPVQWAPDGAKAYAFVRGTARTQGIYRWSGFD